MCQGTFCNVIASRHRAEGEDLRDREEWKQVPAQGGWQTRPPSLPCLPRCCCTIGMQLWNLREADEDVGEHPSRRFCRVSQSPRNPKTAFARNRIRVIVIGDSVLRETEDPIC